MTVTDIFDLRKQGMTAEAYEAARAVYAADKSPYASAAMFWTAVDMLRLCKHDGRSQEAGKIYLALERLLGNVKDENGMMHDALQKCKALIETENKVAESPEKDALHLQTGIWGEALAAAFLREKGYAILERDWHSGHRDIDIIAAKDGLLVFVEVKTRHDDNVATPEQAVNYWKQANLRKAINHYLHYRKVDSPWRFDVIAIIGHPGCTDPIIKHIEDFRLPYR